MGAPIETRTRARHGGRRSCGPWRRRAEANGRHSNHELDELACYCACHEGDLSALKELGDRLEGKPATVIVGDDTARR